MNLFLDEQDGRPKPHKKEMSPVSTIKRSVLPHNTISNRSIVQ